jgi:AcrR family transcriptional regulator
MPKIVNHDEYRQEMLQKSFYYFGSKGYSNITMRDIAAELGISSGALYHYFPSKEDMLNDLIFWAGLKNVNEYIQRISAVENIRDRFDMVMVVLKKSCKFYQNILLLAFDKYRHTDIEKVNKDYDLFSKRFIDFISENLEISRQLAHSIFMYIIGIIFDSLAVGKVSEYNKQIDYFETILRPLILGTPEETEKAAQRFKETFSAFPINKFVPPNTTITKKRIKKPKLKSEQ